MLAIAYPQFYGVGGITRYLDSFFSNLPENSPKIYLITGDENIDDRQFPNVEIINLPFTSTRLGKFLWMLKARKVLRKLYAEGKIKAVNLHIPPLIPGLLLPKEIPLVLTSHSTYLGISGQFYKLYYKQAYFDGEWNILEVAIKRKMEAYIYKQASHIITLTEQGKTEMGIYRVDKPLAVIPNGVDTQAFQPNKTVEKEYDLLFCGRIELCKGSRAIPEICKTLIQKKDDIRILIVGDGNDGDWVRESLAPYNEHVTLTGKVPFSEIQNYYHKSKLYVSTSFYEGLPGTCLEAMAMGLPVVVWDFLFYKSLVVDGETGLVNPPKAYESMATRIIELLNDQKKLNYMSQQARLKVEQEYHWGKLATEIIEVCKTK